MCGIAGLVSFTRDLTREGALAERMAAALGLRGPDQDGTWTGRHAAFGFRRNAVVDLSGGWQPMTAKDAGGLTTTVLDYTGELFNTAQLRAELFDRGHRFREQSDTEVVLHAYLEWGEDCAAHLRGMFAFAVWDAVAERLVLIRDRFGVYPLCYAEVADGLLFGSEPKALFASGLCEPVTDREGLRELLAFTPTPGATVFRGVSEVVPGETVVYDREGLRRRRYWRLEARPHTEDHPATVRAVRELLEDAVRSQLDADVPVGALLSGGLDSSVICALIRDVRGSAEPLHTYSMEFDYHLTSFRPDEQFPDPDSPFAHLMSRHLNTVHGELVLGAADSASPAEMSAITAAMDRPTARIDMYGAVHRLALNARASSKVVLSGDGADELFGGYSWSHDPARVATHAFPWFGPRHRPGDFSGLLDQALVKELDLDSYAADRYAEAVAEVPVLDGEPAAERRMRELTYLHMTRYVRIALDRKDRMGSAAALEGRVPFCDHALVEYVFNVPWAMKSAGGREKALLRAAVRDLVPAEVLDRKKSPFPKLQDPAYDAALRQRLRELAADSASPIADLLDSAAVASVLAGEADAPAVGRMSIEMAIMLDTWVREQKVTVAA